MVPSMKHSGSLIRRAAGMELSEIAVHYQVHDRADGKSPRTVESHGEVLEKLRRWLEAEGRSTLLGDVDEITVREFIVYVQGLPGTKGPTVSSHTVYNRVNALRSFFSWLHRQGYTKENVLGRTAIVPGEKTSTPAPTGPGLLHHRPLRPRPVPVYGLRRGRTAVRKTVGFRSESTTPWFLRRKRRQGRARLSLQHYVKDLLVDSESTPH